MDCVFCEIVKGKLPKTLIAQSENFMVIENVEKSYTKMNYLLVSKDHLETFLELKDEHFKEFKDLIKGSTKDVGSFFLRTNVGPPYQTVFHAHVHILSGEKIK